MAEGVISNPLRSYFNITGSSAYMQYVSGNTTYRLTIASNGALLFGSRVGNGEWTLIQIDSQLADLIINVANLMNVFKFTSTATILERVNSSTNTTYRLNLTEGGALTIGKRVGSGSWTLKTIDSI